MEKFKLCVSDITLTCVTHVLNQKRHTQIQSPICTSHWESPAHIQKTNGEKAKKRRSVMLYLRVKPTDSFSTSGVSKTRPSVADSAGKDSHSSVRVKPWWFYSPCLSSSRSLSSSSETSTSSSSNLFLGSQVILFSFLSRLRALANQVLTCKIESDK